LPIRTLLSSRLFSLSFPSAFVTNDELMGFGRIKRKVVGAAQEDKCSSYIPQCAIVHVNIGCYVTMFE